MLKMIKEQRNDFLRIECVVIVTRYLDIISEQYLSLGQFDLLKDKVSEKLLSDKKVREFSKYV